MSGQVFQGADGEWYEVIDDAPQHDPRLDDAFRQMEELEQQIAEQNQLAEQAALEAQGEQAISQLEEIVEAQLAEIPGLTERDKDMIVSRAVAMEPLQDGTLNVFAAAEELDLWRNQGRPPPAEELPLEATAAERREWMANRLRATERAQREDFAERYPEQAAPSWEKDGRAEPNLDDDKERREYLANRLEQEDWED